MGMVFQHFNLFPHLTIMKNITLAPVLLGRCSKAEADERANALLKRIGLSDKANAYPSQLSGGQKQRVAIAGIIALRPDIIIFDESTAMLDPRGRNDVLETIEKLNREYGTTILHITHYMEEAIRADRVIVVDSGRILLDGTPREVFSNVKALKKVGLDVPQVTELMLEIREDGFELPGGILSCEEGAAAIASYLDRRKSAPPQNG